MDPSGQAPGTSPWPHGEGHVSPLGPLLTELGPRWRAGTTLGGGQEPRWVDGRGQGFRLGSRGRATPGGAPSSRGLAQLRPHRPILSVGERRPLSMVALRRPQA